jgi:hypothetical protein
VGRPATGLGSSRLDSPFPLEKHEAWRKMNFLKSFGALELGQFALAYFRSYLSLFLTQCDLSSLQTISPLSSFYFFLSF